MNRPVHFEILTDEPERLAAFYSRVLGWQVATWDGPQSYWLVTTGPDGSSGINGGIMHRHLDQAVINTIEVASLEQTIAAVEDAGGQKVYGPHDIPDVGRHAYCTDPAGTVFGLLEPVAR
jgi:predicted enzyme related to lactoylglutathione lyase